MNILVWCDYQCSW